MFRHRLIREPIAKHYASIERENIMTKKLVTHAERVAERNRVNGQPNGYRPVTEAELQLAKALGLEKALKDQGFKLEIEALEGSERRREALDLPKVA
jgi:hypothetical protein